MKKIILAIVFLSSMIAVRAQQDPAYSMYVFNGLFINPAYAGSHEVVSLMGIYRQQWVGLTALRVRAISASTCRSKESSMPSVLSCQTTR